MRNRSVQLGLIAITSICIMILLMAMFYYYKVQNNQNQAIAEISEEQNEEMINQILAIKREQANAVVHENSAWDELVEYIEDPEENAEWVDENIAPMSESYDGADVAIFDSEGKFVFSNPMEGYEKTDFYSDLKIPHLFANDYKNHFYIFIKGSLFEYFGATVVHSNDINTRQESPKGYMFLVREVNDNLLENYNTALGKFSIGLAKNQAELEQAREQHSKMLFYHRDLNNQYGNPIAYIYIYSENELLKLQSKFMPMLYIMFGVVLMMFVAIIIYIRRFIVKPLVNTTQILKDKDEKKLKDLCEMKTEFGIIGKELKLFLNQKNEVDRLYKEADEKQKELMSQYDLLQSQKNEIESQIDNIKVLNLQIMERNKETEKKNVQISVKSKQLEEQNQNIKNLQATIDELEYKRKFEQKSLDKANNALLDNQNYATRLRNVLQVALTPTKHIFNDFFLHNKPKEKIGGDFWFAKKIDNWVIAGVGDCNMQGISGAVLSGVDLYLLDEVLNIRKMSELMPDLVLNDLNEKIQSTMGEEFVTDIERDGLHLSMFMYNTETLKGYFAAAKRTMCIARRGEVIEYYGDNLAIGKIHDGKTFNLIPIQLNADDTVYMYSDGCTEVVGGPFCKKLLAVNFKKEIAKKQIFTLIEQKTQFKKFFEDWIGDLEQTDDITMLTFRI